jgi:hypothetical protein
VETDARKSGARGSRRTFGGMAMMCVLSLLMYA